MGLIPMESFVAQMRVPGTFHDIRKWLEPITYKGEKILAHVGACKQSGCNWRAQYANWPGLVAGIWQHRQQHILEYRIRKLHKHFKGNQPKIKSALRLCADHHTHTEGDWKMAVTRTMRELEPAGTFKAEDFGAQLLTYYSMGMMAIQAANRIYDLHFAVARAV